jgi:hypothetical protein
MADKSLVDSGKFYPPDVTSPEARLCATTPRSFRWWRSTPATTPFRSRSRPNNGLSADRTT